MEGRGTMEAVYVVGALVGLVLCFVIGTMAQNRGHSFAAYFFLSLIFTPVIALLILLASTSTSPAVVSATDMLSSDPKQTKTPAALAWDETKSSLDVDIYSDFLTAFSGTQEALLAARHKRQIETWSALDKSSGTDVIAFWKNEPFLALRSRIVDLVNAEAPTNEAFFTIQEDLAADLEKRTAVQAEQADLQLKAQATVDELSRSAILEAEANHDAMFAGTVTGILFLIAIVGYFILQSLAVN